MNSHQANTVIHLQTYTYIFMCICISKCLWIWESEKNCSTDQGRLIHIHVMYGHMSAINVYFGEKCIPIQLDDRRCWGFSGIRRKIEGFVCPLHPCLSPFGSSYSNLLHLRCSLRCIRRVRLCS